jgi:hypothetical protein
MEYAAQTKKAKIAQNNLENFVERSQWMDQVLMEVFY